MPEYLGQARGGQNSIADPGLGSVPKTPPSVKPLPRKATNLQTGPNPTSTASKALRLGRTTLQQGFVNGLEQALGNGRLRHKPVGNIAKLLAR